MGIDLLAVAAQAFDEDFGEPPAAFDALFYLFPVVFAIMVGLQIWQHFRVKEMARRRGVDEREVSTVAWSSAEPTVAAMLLQDAEPDGVDVGPADLDPAARLARIEQRRASGALTSEEADAARRGVIGEL